MGKHNSIASQRFFLSKISGNWQVLFAISPLAALLTALKSFRGRTVQTILWLFCVFFGFTFHYGDLNALEGADSIRYANELIYFSKQSFSFPELLGMMYNPSFGYTDIYQPLATWMVALFTDNPRWLFALFGAVFGFFYVKNLSIILTRIPFKIHNKIVLFLFVLTYALAIPIWYINGVRMWTGAHVFIFGLFNIIINGNSKGYIWTVISVLFHWSFMLPCLILVIFRFIPKNITWLTVFFFLSFLVSEVNLLAVNNNLSFLPEIFQYKVDAYTNEEYAESVQSSQQALNWHVTTAGFCGRVVLYTWILVLYLYRKKWVDKLPQFAALFKFALFLGGISLIASNIPSGFRYFGIAKVVFYACIVMALNQEPFALKTKFVGQLTILPLLFYEVFIVRTGFDYMSVQTLITNPVLAFFWETKVPLIDYVKNIF